MKFNELTISEKSELRETLYYEQFNDDGYTDFSFLSDDEKDIVTSCTFSEEIPDSILESAYGIYDFVPGDFFCNTDDQFCDRQGNEY